MSAWRIKSSNRIPRCRDPSRLEKLALYLKLLAPQLSSGEKDTPIDLSAVAIDYLGHHQQQTRNGTLEPGTPLEPSRSAGTGTVRDPDMVALDEVIDRINDLFSGDHPDHSVRSVVTHIKDRLEDNTSLQKQAQNNSYDQFTASPDIDTAFTDAVIGSMDSAAVCLRSSSTTRT